ncbi:ADP-ribosylglycohydrolase family protein [Acetobacterium sp.]|uniref:ADP-ribosylglycohydrolase family protein n=1 Tax=Acetobacterium sp. TaxID=1872094 RepID=UPI003594487F
MLGAIIGDIVGSRFEWHNHKNKEFDFLSDRCFFTDDSVLSLAIAKAILVCAGDYQDLEQQAVTAMQEVGRPYPNCGYGGMFRGWLYADQPKPYNSFGNGAAMRVSACGFAATSLAEAKELSRKVTAVTHNHPEGLKGAEATAVAIYLAKTGESRLAIGDFIRAHYYPLDFTLEEIRDTYTFNETCQETVPQAIVAFLEATDFEDAIRNAISIGGDSDTLAAITGAIAEAYYGVPSDISEKALSYLDEELRAIYDEWAAFIARYNERISPEGEKRKNFQLDEQQFLVIKDSTNIDVLDENLYSYDSAIFALTPAIQNRTSNSLLEKIEQFIDSTPAIQKAADNIKSKTEYIPRLDLIPEEIKQALQNGAAELIPCRESADAFFLQIRTTVKGLTINGKEYGIHRKIKEIPLGTKSIPTDVTGAMQCLSMQRQLNQIADGLKEISETCKSNFGRIIQGQRDDRLAKLFSSRSCFIQALAMSDESLQRQMLIQALVDANSARAELAFQIKSDIALLGGTENIKAKDMVKLVCDINTAIVVMNNAVQISLYSYQVLGERNAQLAVVKEHETFVKQVLLKNICCNGKKHLAWELICSSGNRGSNQQDFGLLPGKLLLSCDAFIENKRKNSTDYLEDKSDE